MVSRSDTIPTFGLWVFHIELLVLHEGYQKNNNNGMSKHVGLSENSVPLNPLDDHHFPYHLIAIWGCTVFSDTPMWMFYQRKNWIRPSQLSS
jgi:hypothetical protein